MPDHPSEPDPAPKPDGPAAAEPDLVAQFLDEALIAREEGRESPLAAWSLRHPAFAPEFERATRTASDIALVRARVGPVIPGFEIDAEIGRGGMGVVYRARQSNLSNRAVAIKVLGPSAALTPRSIARFRAEAKALATLRHPNVVAVYDVIEQKGELAYVMEYVDGGSLERLLQFLTSQSGATPPAAPTPPRQLDGVREFLQDTIGIVQEPNYVLFICRMAIALARALDAVHREGLLHRDIKPANVLMRRDGTPLLTDFGLAVDSGGESLPGVAPSSSTGAGSAPEFTGTLGYAAPEQLRGRALGRRSDIFALGATVYHALALRPAFAGSTPRDVLAQMEAGPPDLTQCNPDVPADLAAIIRKCMATDPFERYASAGELAMDLERLLRLEPVRARVQSRGYVLRKLIARNRATFALAGAALMLLVLGIFGTSLGMVRARTTAVRAERLAAESAANEYFATIQSAAAALALNDSFAAKDRLERIDPARRAWEWRYLRAQSDQSAGRIVVPGTVAGEVPLIAFSDDGSTLFAASRESVTAFDAETWKVRWTTPTNVPKPRRPIALLPGWNNDAWIVDSAGGIASVTQGGTVATPVPPGTGTVTSADWSPARDRIVLLENIDGQPQLRVVDYEGKQPDRITRVSVGKASTLAIEPAVGIVFCTGPGGTETLRWPALDPLNLPNHSLQTSVATNPPGGIFVTAGPRGLLVSDSDDAQLPADLDGLAAPQALASVPGKPIVLGGSRRVLAVWEAFRGGLTQRLLGHEFDIVAITASPDARTAVSTDAGGHVLRWNIEPVVRPFSRQWAAELPAASVATTDFKIQSPGSTVSLEARVATDDPSAVEIRKPGTNWSRAQFSGTVNAILIHEPGPTVFVAVRGSGVHILGEISRNGTLEHSSLLMLGPSGSDIQHLAMNGDTLVASGPSGETRWRTTHERPTPSRQVVHELLSANNAYSDAFGNGLDSDTHRLIVGSPYSGVLGAWCVGTAVVYRRDLQTGWTQEARLVPSAAMLHSGSGFSVAIDGEWAAVGWPGGIGRSVEDSGGVTLFHWQRGRWSESQTLRAASPAKGDHFGWSIALHRGVLAVGATGTWDQRETPNPVSVFTLKDGTWTRIADIEQPVAIKDSRFGHCVDLWNGTLLIGERLVPQAGLANVGQVHIYTVHESNVTLEATVRPEAPQHGMEFGNEVSIHGTRFAAGSPNATDGAGNSGRVDMYRQGDDGRWNLERTFPPTVGAPTHQMGTKLKMAESYVLASSHDHEKFVLLPVDAAESPKQILPKVRLNSGAHFGGAFAWLGDGFAVSADLDSRYDASAGSVWLFPDTRTVR